MKRKLFHSAAALTLGFLVTPVALAQFGAGPAELELIKLQDDLYVIYNDFVPGNVTVLISDDGVLLVDNKYPVDFDNIMALLATVTDQPVKYVINTHYHGDHSGSNAKLQALNAHVFASEAARSKMVEINQPGLPNVTVIDHMRLYVGGKPVDMYYFGRAHTDGDVVVHFPEHDTLAAGDIFTVGDDLPQLVDYAGGGSARDWVSTLDGALKLDFDTVVPGHGPVTNKQVMQNYRESTLRLRTTVRELLSQNRSRDDVEAVMRSEFHWADLHVQMGLDGMLIELR